MRNKSVLLLAVLFFLSSVADAAELRRRPRDVKPKKPAKVIVVECDWTCEGQRCYSI